MDSDKSPPQPPHRTASTSSSTTTSDLFICFTARHHSMKLSSKSILSPGRPGGGRDPISLTTSLSRRLRTSRSIKGGASPAMFPTTGKKRGGGSGFENAEPSSPKVTCIGQVRVKSKKKQTKKLRTLSRRHSTGDVSFRKLDHGFSKSSSLGSNSFGENKNNQRWVHLPLTICEAIRAFGSEFSCLFPCRSSCFSPAKEEKTSGESGSGSGSCVAVFTRWLVAFQDDGVREDENEEEEEESLSIRRHHVFDDLEIVNDRIEGCKDEARVSICIPPKNALLLMRCRSDPLKMEALANRLWEPTFSQNDEEDEEEEEEEYVYYQEDEILNEFEANQEQEISKKQSLEKEEENQEILEVNVDEELDEELSFFGSLFEEIEEKNESIEEETSQAREIVKEVESKLEKVKDEEMVNQFTERSETIVEESKERENCGVLEREGLPECLLLMMCEPKLSMEVSKETWVSSKDFIRRQSSRKKAPPPPPPPPPHPPVKPINGQDESKVSAATTTFSTKSLKQVAAADSALAAATTFQPRRSSCSLPAPPSMAEMLEQKLVNAVGYEPFVLTRCKSEPMRTAAAKLAPDTCFWKNRKLEPLRRASYGVGAAGVGF